MRVQGLNTFKSKLFDYNFFLGTTTISIEMNISSHIDLIQESNECKIFFNSFLTNLSVFWKEIVEYPFLFFLQFFLDIYHLPYKQIKTFLFSRTGGRTLDSITIN